MTWSCAACTLINESQRNSCKVCGTPRVSFASDIKDEPSTKRQRTAQKISISERVGMDQRITWDPTLSDETLDEWLEAVRPSQVSSSQCAWISVNNVTPKSPGYHQPPTNTSSLDLLDTSQYHQALNKIDHIVASKGRVKGCEKQECVDSILEIAKARGDTTGKWMLFCRPQYIDEVWSRVAKETANGNLGCAAKVGPAFGVGEKPILICVYVQDFTNRDEVKRVLWKLQEMRLNVKSRFKPDVFTSLGIESNNKWRLPPTIYSVKDVMES